MARAVIGSVRGDQTSADLSRLHPPPGIGGVGGLGQIDGSFRSVALSLDGTRVAAGDGDDIKIFDVSGGRKLTVPEGHGSSARVLAIRSDGSWVASAGWDVKIVVRDVATGKELTTLKAEIGR